jgi:hypothetical protein
MFRTGFVFTMCCVLVICFACSGESAAPQDGARYLLVSGMNGFCVDVPASSMEEGRQLILWTINNLDRPSPNQVWRLQAAGNEGEYRIVSEQNAMCLSVEEASLKDGAHIVQLHNEEDAANQIWTFVKNRGEYSLCSKLSSKMLTVSGYGTDRGAALVQFEPLDKADSQVFKLLQVK